MQFTCKESLITGVACHCCSNPSLVLLPHVQFSTWCCQHCLQPTSRCITKQKDAVHCLCIKTRCITLHQPALPYNWNACKIDLTQNKLYMLVVRQYTSSLFGSCVLYSLSTHIVHDCALPNTVHYPLLHCSLLHYLLLPYLLLYITHYCIIHYCTLLNTAYRTGLTGHLRRQHRCRVPSMKKWIPMTWARRPTSAALLLPRMATCSTSGADPRWCKSL